MKRLIIIVGSTLSLALYGQKDLFNENLASAVCTIEGLSLPEIEYSPEMYDVTKQKKLTTTIEKQSNKSTVAAPTEPFERTETGRRKSGRDARRRRCSRNKADELCTLCEKKTIIPAAPPEQKSLPPSEDVHLHHSRGPGLFNTSRVLEDL